MPIIIKNLNFDVLLNAPNKGFHFYGYKNYFFTFYFISNITGRTQFTL